MEALALTAKGWMMREGATSEAEENFAWKRAIRVGTVFAVGIFLAMPLL
jgi:hypothetical protein